MNLELELEKMRDMSERWDREEKAARDLGIRLGAEIKSQMIKGLGGFTTLFKANTCAMILDAMTQDEPDRECAELLLKWTFNRYWGIEVERHLPMFDEYWTWLHDHNARRDNPLVWGDIDCSAWIELPKAKDRRVLVVVTHCACRDDNTHLFIYDKGTLFNNFHVRTCWPRTIRIKGYRKSQGWEMLKHPSLTLYRQMDFKPNYGDCRDNGYCFSYKRIVVDPTNVKNGEVDNGHAAMLDIYWALWTLRGVGAGIERPCELPRSNAPEGGR